MRREHWVSFSQLQQPPGWMSDHSPWSLDPPFFWSLHRFLLQLLYVNLEVSDLWLFWFPFASRHKSEMSPNLSRENSAFSFLWVRPPVMHGKGTWGFVPEPRPHLLRDGLGKFSYSLLVCLPMSPGRTKLPWPFSQVTRSQKLSQEVC